ncbi:hypothetical protein AB3H99_03975 [Enterococcus sp. GC33]|uniref:hypothetical protein n=1 Tax=unclassified Enterococcus TaxID=2608891 RepID=UPI0034A0A6B9
MKNLMKGKGLVTEKTAIEKIRESIDDSISFDLINVGESKYVVKFKYILKDSVFKRNVEFSLSNFEIELEHIVDTINREFYAFLFINIDKLIDSFVADEVVEGLVIEDSDREFIKETYRIEVIKVNFDNKKYALLMSFVLGSLDNYKNSY